MFKSIIEWWLRAQTLKAIAVKFAQVWPGIRPLRLPFWISTNVKFVTNDNRNLASNMPGWSWTEWRCIWILNLIQLINYSDTIICFFATASVQKSYLKLQPPPNQPIVDWLTWTTRSLFERLLSKKSSKIAGIMGINKAGDIQSLYVPKWLHHHGGDVCCVFVLCVADVSHLERYCTNVILVHLTKVRC